MTWLVLGRMDDRLIGCRMMLMPIVSTNVECKEEVQRESENGWEPLGSSPTRLLYLNLEIVTITM